MDSQILSDLFGLTCSGFMQRLSLYFRLVFVFDLWSRRFFSNFCSKQQRCTGYRKVLQEIKQAQPELPKLRIQAENVSVSVQVPVKKQGIDNVAKALIRPFIPLKGEMRNLDVLKNVSVTVQPGSMTLVLAAPGHGRSALLKLLAGQLPATDGRVRWNQMTKEQARQHGMSVEKLVAYADQVDVHLPSMTVRETFQFAVDHAFDPAPYNSDKLNFIHRHKVDMILKQLGLEECANTIVGNEYVRGVSGGQRKRVTLGEVLCSDARALFLDEVTSGLDASTALDVFTTMRDWVDILGGSCVAALLQPGPELLQLFDQLILLREGEVVYSGPTCHVLPYFESVGLYRPTYQDPADFLVEFLSHPYRTYRRQLDERLSPQCEVCLWIGHWIGLALERHLFVTISMFGLRFLHRGRSRLRTDRIRWRIRNVETRTRFSISLSMVGLHLLAPLPDPI